MATHTARPTAAANSADQEQFIEKQIQVTRSQVKMVSVATEMTTLLAGILAFLIIVSLIDHWVWGLNLWARLLALIVLLVGGAAFFVWRILPGLMRPVNPVYAAQTIEQSAPSLKNSLINFLLLRRQEHGVRQVVYDGVRRQAAADLRHVQIESAVDRSELIRVGYVLAALVVLFGLYRILSPKDPFQTVARVAAPWKAIARPSRAKIEQVEPGNAEIYRGQSLEVSAVVDGLREDEQVKLIYSTSDGQIVDQVESMFTDGGHRHQCELTTGSTGIQHDLIYRIQAGDARTEPYRVTVKDAPSIIVQRVTYLYPQYTNRPEEQVEDQGDLVALEGTRVRIDALANQPIRNAYLELFDGGGDDLPVKSVPMTHRGEVAEGQMTLTLRPDRKTPAFAAYQLRFQNSDGHRNQEPARYQIEVIPDLPPLVEILNPRRREVELPENRTLMVEVRALDPDFGLNAVRLHAAAGGLELLKHSLLDGPYQGQAVFTHQLQPNRLGLSEGDILIYWAEAEDNRRAAGTSAAAANRKRSENYRIRVVAPEEDADRDQSQDSPTERSSDASDDQDAAEDGASQPGEQGGGGQGDDASAASESASESSESGEATAADQAPEPDGQGGGAPREQGPDSEQDSAEGKPPRDGDSASGDSSSEEATADQEGNQEGDTDPSEGQRSGRPGDRDRQQQRGRSQEPVTSDGSNDADAFERILEHKRDQDLRAGESRPDAERSEPATEDAAEQAERSPRDGGSPDQAAEDQPDDSRASRGDDSDTDSDRQQQPGAKSTPDDDASVDDAARGPREPGLPERTADSDEASRPDRSSQASESAADRDASADPKQQPAGGDPASQQRPADASSAGSDRQQSKGTSAEDAQRDQPLPDAADSSSAAQRTKASPDPGSTQADPARDSDVESADEGGRQRSASDESPQAPQDPSAQPSEQGNSRSADAGGDPSSTGDTPADREDGDRQARTGGQPGDGRTVPTDSVSGEPGEDEANLEYARQATDLALEHLQDQQDNRELLDKLGWTQEDVRRFLQRWQQMKRDADQQGARGNRARQEFDDQVRGLGLRPNQTKTRTIQRDSGFTRLRDDGARSAPPSEYRELYRAFLRGKTREQNSATDR